LTKHNNLKDAYDWMLNFAKVVTHETEDNLSIKLHYLMDKIKNQAYTLEEFSREEIDKVADYLQRDIHDAAEYLSEEGRELQDWLKFDVELIEDRLLELLSSAINTTNIELDNLNETAQRENLCYKGEVTSPGSFLCDACGYSFSSFGIQELPACPECGGDVFKRVSA